MARSPRFLALLASPIRRYICFAEIRFSVYRRFLSATRSIAEGKSIEMAFHDENLLFAFPSRATVQEQVLLVYLRQCAVDINKSRAVDQGTINGQEKSF